MENNIETKSENQEEKQQISKVMKLIIAVLVLMFLFVICGIFIKSTETREDKIISYLEKQYGTEFEIVELTNSGEKILFHELSCDGSIFCPEITDEDTIVYEYEIESLADNIIFALEYEDGKLSDKISSMYFTEKYSGEIVEDIGNYIIDLIGNDKTVLEVYPLTKMGGKYKSAGSIYIYTNQELNKVISKEYVEKIEKIPQYIREKVSGENNIELSIDIMYNDEMRIWFNESNASELLYDLTVDSIYPLDYDLEEYLRKLNK